MSWFYLINLVTQSTTVLGMYDHLIFCIHCSNNALNSAFGRQNALAGKMFVKDQIMQKKKNIPHKMQYNFWWGGGVKSG